MKIGKELILASKQFAREDPFRSWMETLLTLLLSFFSITATYLESVPLLIRMVCSICTGLFYVRLFVIYHDYQHRAILQGSSIATFLMRALGIYLLAPETIWKRSHEHHHNNNSKLTTAGIGSYPTISKTRFLSLSKGEQRLYLINRHPLTVLFGYFTLFLYWLNIKSLIQSPAKHIDSFLALLFHGAAGWAVWYYLGTGTFLLGWFIPFFLAFAMGSYLFYCQHNFPNAKFCENPDWKYDHAALASTSYMVMHPIMQWFTANIGYHHVHHLNSRIPFYRLKETVNNMPELQNVSTTSWHPLEMARCFRLKLWDADRGKMITLRQL